MDKAHDFTVKGCHVIFDFMQNCKKKKEAKYLDRKLVAAQKPRVINATIAKIDHSNAFRWAVETELVMHY